jgi:twitching motility protein PilT
LVRTAQADADWWVRERAIATIAAINDARAVPYLLDILQNVPDLRLACVEAFTAMAAQAAAPHVAALLAPAGDDGGAEQAGKLDIDLKLAVLSCLAALDDPAQAQAVLPLSEDEDHRVRGQVRDLLARWKTAASPAASAAAAKAYSLLERLLISLAQSEGDDLIIAGGHKPYMKKIGKVLPLANHVFTPEQVKALLLPHLKQSQLDDLAALRDVDFSFEFKAEGLRFRVNVFQQMPGLSAVFRIVKDKIPLLEDLGLPAVVKTFAEAKNGLVLVGGPTASGKSTTLAGIIDHINRTTSRHIITLEDPIEVMHKAKKCLINQREIGTHTRSFASALRATLREDPDVILVGEMRDLATIQFAMAASETGHLVLGTLHTVSVDTCIDRIVNAFPAGQQDSVRSLLADSLRAVMCQYLLRRKDGPGRVTAIEILINNEAIANLIRKGKTFQIPSVIATQRDAGMQSMDWDLERLFRAGIISGEDAYAKASNKKNFEVILGITTGGDGKAVGGADPKAPGASSAAAPPAGGVHV